MGIEIDGANQKLILDSDGDTYLEAATDDTIKVYIAGAHDATISANAINVLSGTTLTIDSGATITNSGTANGFSSANPASADGDTLGTASLEWSDLFLADGGTIQFGNDQEIKLTHVADTGLTLKHTATADDKPVSLTLQTGETDIAANDVIGKIDFQAPDEGTGTDAILVAAGIEAVSEGDFSSSNNATKLSFKTAASEAAAEKMSLSSAGLLTVANGVTLTDGDITVASGHGISFAATSDGSSASNVAEVFDDYETGTFTPALAPVTNSYTTSGTQLGFYTKIGKMVHIQISSTITNVGSGSGNINVTGLPFTSASTGPIHTMMTSARETQVQGQNDEIIMSRDVTALVILGAHHGNGMEYSINFVYRVA
tara:strand:+ start:36 stop:1151 length:1116 start_codon:yes stop_codon:yes gene_type:complete